MKQGARGTRRCRRQRPLFVFVCGVFLFAMTAAASAQNFALQLDAQHTTVNFTLGDVLHTVHGTFRLKQGALQFDPASGKLAGEIIVDAKSGETGNGMRDRKMHREVLESDKFPEIAFRPDHVDGAVSLSGKSTVRVHGIFSTHGSEHELTVPAEVEMFPDRWKAAFHFTLPYVSWGMKNPSTLFLRVSESVDIDVTTSGSIARGSMIRP
jgi:polyisoprenoid-binding protein YceI